MIVGARNSHKGRTELRGSGHALRLDNEANDQTEASLPHLDRNRADRSSEVRRDPKLAESLGVYEFLLRDQSPLSQDAVNLMKRLHMSSRPRFTAYLGRRQKRPLRSVAVGFFAVVWLAIVVSIVVGIPPVHSALVKASPFLHSIRLSTLIIPLVALGIMVLGVSCVRIATTKYTIAKGRVQIETGLLARSARNLELWRVERVDLHKSLPNRLTGDGTLVFTVRGEPKPILLTGLARGRALEEIRQQLMNLVFALRSNQMVKGIIQ